MVSLLRIFESYSRPPFRVFAPLTRESTTGDPERSAVLAARVHLRVGTASRWKTLTLQLVLRPVVEVKPQDEAAPCDRGAPGLRQCGHLQQGTIRFNHI
jgi:hypothetical protein